jgi:aminobenzoyl-glutamate transport protein
MALPPVNSADPQGGPTAAAASASSPARRTFTQRALDQLERVGNMLPDPAVLFLLGLLITWLLSWLLAGVEFAEIDPRTGEPIRIANQLTGPALAHFLAGMVTTFTSFAPLGIVLVALLGVGVAEHSGFINACLKGLLRITPRMLLTPMLILVAIVSHTAADAGYVLVIPLGGVIFYAAGRHPLAGIGAAFAGVSGGFSANVVPSGLDPLLAGLTQSGVSVLDAGRTVNPLCNFYFTASSSLLIILVGWFLTDRVIEPRLRGTPIDGDPENMPKLAEVTTRERAGMWAGLAIIVLGLTGLVLWAWPADSALRAPDGSLTSMRPAAPLMEAIVPLIFLLFLLPGIVHGYIAGTFKSHRDVVQGMSKSMGTMAYYLVLVFFAALFIAAFRDSNLGALLALKGASFLKELGAPAGVTIVGVILLTALVNLVIGSASAKWALLAPIFVPMLMSLGLSPELTQTAYRIGDSTANIITPMMPYFPLVVVFCQRYVRGTGIGTLVSLMLPYSLAFLVLWSIYLLVYWGLGLPLGLQAPYTYP